MNLTLQTCFVLVHDPDEALRFYRDTLGLELRNDVARGEFRFISVGSAAQPEVSILLTNYLDGSPADQEAVAGLIAKGALNGVNFRSEDVEAAFASVSAAGAEVVQEPADQHWGVRDFAVRDPSGNMIRIDQAPRSSPPAVRPRAAGA